MDWEEGPDGLCRMEMLKGSFHYWELTWFASFGGRGQRGLHCCKYVDVGTWHFQEWEIRAFKWILLILLITSIHNWVEKRSQHMDCGAPAVSWLREGHTSVLDVGMTCL